MKPILRTVMITAALLAVLPVQAQTPQSPPPNSAQQGSAPPSPGTGAPSYGMGWGAGHGMMGPGMMGPGMMGPGMGGYGMGGGMMGWGRGAANPQDMCNAMSSHMEGRLAYMKAELKITPAQEPLWDAYAKVARDNAEGMTSRCLSMTDQGGPKTLSLPDRLERHEQFMAAQLDALRNLDKALKPLYGALSDGQKKIADQLMFGPMGMM